MFNETLRPPAEEFGGQGISQAAPAEPMKETLGDLVAKRQKEIAEEGRDSHPIRTEILNAALELSNGDPKTPLNQAIIDAAGKKILQLG